MNKPKHAHDIRCGPNEPRKAVTPMPDDQWPPDDTEEAMRVHSPRDHDHQPLIGMEGAARLARAPDGPEPWKVLSHTALSGRST